MARAYAIPVWIVAAASCVIGLSAFLVIRSQPQSSSTCSVPAPPGISTYTASFPEWPEERKTASAPQLAEEVSALRQELHSLRVKYGAAYCLLHGLGPTGGFCLNPSNLTANPGNNIICRKICKELVQLFDHSSVLDLGCGTGDYGICFRQHDPNFDYTGYDGSENIEAVTQGAVKFADLSKPVFLGRLWDWVMSLEVGEHLPKEFEAIFIDNLVRHARKGLVLSWALPGQGGHYHVNEQPNSYIVEQLAARGFSLDVELSTQLRTNVSAITFWLQNTMMVFHRSPGGGPVPVVQGVVMRGSVAPAVAVNVTG